MFSTLVLPIELGKKKRKGNTISAAVNALPSSNTPPRCPVLLTAGLGPALAGENPVCLLQDLRLKPGMPFSWGGHGRTTVSSGICCQYKALDPGSTPHPHAVLDLTGVELRRLSDGTCAPNEVVKIGLDPHPMCGVGMGAGVLKMNTRRQLSSRENMGRKK